MRVVDLFCGCGGLSLGFLRAGMDIVASYDNWDSAIAVYNANFIHEAVKLDLSDEVVASDSISRNNPDMIIGGPPCQDFSSAGLRNEDNGRGGLTLSYAKIISQVHPMWFVMENVSTITKTKKLAEAIGIFKACGYGLTQLVLNAALCGVPQKRKRFFLIGHIGAQDGFLLKYLIGAMSKKEMTLRDYFGETLGIECYYRHPRSYARRGIFSIDEPSPTIRGVNRPLPSGYKLHHNDPVNDLSGIRPLTQYERSLIQTFPPDYKFLGSKSDIEQMIGNAVPVNLGTFVANAINSYISELQDARGV